LPNRDLDVARIALIADKEPQIDPATTTDRSMLATEPILIHSTRSDVYALTHDIFFCTDFGVEKYSVGDITDYNIGTTLDGLLLRFIASGHSDLVLELLLSGVVTGQLSPSLVGLTLGWIEERTTDHGHVPGPDSVVAPPTMSGTRSHDDDKRPDPKDVSLPTEWLEDYHTSLVAGMVGRHLIHMSDRVFDTPVKIEDEDCSPSIRDYSNGGAVPDPASETWDVTALMHLGEALNAFSDYQLQDGAEHVASLRNQRLPSDLHPVLAQIESFLRSQRRTDDTFGHWTDERRKFQQLGHEIDAFERGPLRRTSVACREALDVIEDELRGSRNEN
jgi:hypothetical protein